MFGSAAWNISCGRISKGYARTGTKAAGADVGIIGGPDAVSIITMTANALEEDKEAALKNGMNMHIVKPLDIDIFISVLHQFLD